MHMHIAVIPGDGIGPEITQAAKTVLSRAADRFGHEITYTEVCAGGAAIDRFGDPLPEAELENRQTAYCWARWAARSGTVPPAVRRTRC